MPAVAHPNKKVKTKGLHPKVAWPVVTGVTAAVVLWLVGQHDAAKDVFLAALGLGGVGAAAPAGRSLVEADEPAAE